MLICAGKCHDIPESRGLLSASSFRELMRPQKIPLMRLPMLGLSPCLLHRALLKERKTKPQQQHNKSEPER